MHDLRTRLPLRAQLQAGTRAVHERLDTSVGTLDLSCPAAYARFLATQLSARDGIEQWADRHCLALLRPPSVTNLLRDDLAELALLPQLAAATDFDVLTSIGPFTLPAGADPLGLAWAIAGSQMGNRAILVRMLKAAERAGHAAPLPFRFLADPRMTGFWHRLLPRLQQPVSPSEAEPALAAARAVFARFEQAFSGDMDRCRQAA